MSSSCDHTHRTDCSCDGQEANDRALLPLHRDAVVRDEFELRPYQRDGIEAVRRYLDGGGTAGLLVWPTGAGKSVALAAIAEYIVSRGGRVLIVSHVAELVEQDAVAVERVLGSDAVGIISNGLGRRKRGRPVTVASIQSIYLRPEQVGPIDVVIVDEAHLVSYPQNGMYARLLSALRRDRPVALIGLTATPYRMSSGRLTDPFDGQPPLFDRIVHEASIRDLIADKYLARPIAMATRRAIDTAGIGISQGEFRADQMELAVSSEELNRAIVSEIIESGRDRRSWLVFASSVVHAHALTREFFDAEYSAAVIDGNTPSDQRRELIGLFRSGKIRCLVGCNIFTTGFDAPAVDLIAVCRPTLSPSLHVQMLGRGTRLSPATGKTDCLVLDFAGNCARHGPLDLIDGERTSDEKRGGGKPRSKPCPACSTLVAIAARQCAECGAAFEIEAPETKLLPSAVAAPVLSDDEPEGEWKAVRSIRVRCHEKNGSASIKIEYLTERSVIPILDFLHFDSSSQFAKRMASRRWAELSSNPTIIPRSTSEALRIAGDIVAPDAICVTTNAKGFPTVTGIRRLRVAA